MDPTLEQAVRTFEQVDANLTEIERVSQRIRELVRAGGAVLEVGSDEDREYRSLRGDYEALQGGLPPIDRFRITAVVLEPDEIVRRRAEAARAGGDHVSIAESEIARPHREIDEYRSRFDRKRRKLIRDRVGELVGMVDGALATLAERTADAGDHERVRDATWDVMQNSIYEIGRLVVEVSRLHVWGDLTRHLRIAEVNDLHNIQQREWPVVRTTVQRLEYDVGGPVPVPEVDLAEVVALQPKGGVAGRVIWSNLDGDAFERLVAVILRQTPGFEDVDRPMKTNAPDGGQDISAFRVSRDEMRGGTRRERLSIQCRHWQGRSLALPDLALVVEQAKLWPGPRVATVIFATTGGLTHEALRWIHTRAENGDQPEVEVWTADALEARLMSLPRVVEEFSLR